MASAGVAFVAILLAVAAGLPWCSRVVVRRPLRPDGAPSPAQMRYSALIELVCAALLVGAGLFSHGRLTVLAHLWRHDLPSALLFGALAGLFLHFAGSGSPLPIASLREPRPGRPAGSGAPLVTTLLFLVGETAMVLVWFGAGLPSLLRILPRLPALFLTAAGYGLTRSGAGQDHPLLGAIDGLLLGLLSLLTGSLVAVVIAQFVADVWAYVSAAAQAEDLALAAEAGEPRLPGQEAPATLLDDRVERLG